MSQSTKKDIVFIRSLSNYNIYFFCVVGGGVVLPFHHLIYITFKNHLVLSDHFTYNLSSRHILGPTTLAAPLAILKAKCPGGHDLDSPHLYLTGFTAANSHIKKQDAQY